MKSKVLIATIVVALFPLAAFANECSGGTDGGMDATGNQCNTPPAATTASPDRANTTSTQPTKVAAKKGVARRTATTHNVSTRSRIKHG